MGVDGKFLSAGAAPFRVRGVTYGGFSARVDGWQYPESSQLKRDFAAIAAAGLNTVRTYTLPPPEALEVAAELDLRLLVGLNYHDWRMEPDTGRSGRRRVLDAGRRAVAEAMEMLRCDPSVLAVAVGNEVPVDLVRVHGVGAVEDTLSRLVAEVHDADPGMLATYVNFPTTEFLEVEGQDLVTFNVFLEHADQLRRYLHHLQVVARDRPLVLTELGLAAEIHGEQQQAESLAWQLRTVDETGCAGATVFSWTDEWAVDDRAVEGWGFGITTAQREPKPALAVVSDWAAAEYPASLRAQWPAVSVIVNTYNEERNIGACLDSLLACDYPGLEVIVCDDGSTDATVEIARRYPFEVLALPFIGLAAARNEALAAASGDIVAYLDADAACHRDWPYHLALSLEDGSVSATGGPNLPWPGAAFIERAVALSPGAPAEVLLTDTTAEHVPGCNMAFRKADLEAVGAFDPVFESAGDDVDACWKLLDDGKEIGFAPAAQVVHHRRGTIRGYLKQQRGYGRAERALAGVHPGRFNRLGQARWKGFIYGGSRLLPALFRPVVYSGYMGMAPFQPITVRRAEAVAAWAAALLPFGVPVAVAALALAFLSPWWLLVPGVMGVLAVSYGVGVAAAARVGHRERHPASLRLLVGVLHVLQPLARAWGRVTGRRTKRVARSGRPEWTGERTAWLEQLEKALREQGLTVRPGGPGDTWDLMASFGPMISARVTTAVVWHWEPRSTVSYRPRLPFWAVAALGGVLSVGWSPWVWWAMVGAGVWTIAEAVLVGRRLRSGIRSTTEDPSR